MSARSWHPVGRAVRRAAVALVVLLGMVPAITPAPASAYAGNNDDIYVENFNGIARRPVVTGPGDDEHPSWSPGGRIAFDSNRDGDYDIYIVNSDGNNLVHFDGAGDDKDPAYSPDGRRIAFSSNRSGSSAIWVMNEDGSGLRVLTSGGIIDSRPAWSPDGKRIAFTRYDSSSFNIWVVNADGTGPTQLTRGSTDNDADWSPDGTKIVFGSGHTGITVMNPDGSGQHTIVALGASPAWSPGGARIVYVHIDTKTYADQLWVVAPDGSQNQPFGDQSGDCSEPAWNAGAGQVAFTYHP